MMRYYLGLIAALMLVLNVLTPSASAQTTPDIEAAQGVIDQQIQAFLRDDGETAYGFAAPNIKSLFPTADIFVSMVKRGYQPVYRPRTYSFGASSEENGTLNQSVLIDAQDGKTYEAVYFMGKQPDGSWKITGVVLREAPGADV